MRHCKLTVYTDGVSSLFYLSYCVVCIYFSWIVAHQVSSERNTLLFSYTLALVLFLIILFIGFYYFTLYILSNRIVLSPAGISCRYFGYRYTLKDYLTIPTIAHSLNWDQVFIVLPNSLNDLPKSFSYMSRSDFRNRLFFSAKLPKEIGSCYGNLPSFLIILKNGRSRLICTEPFSRRSIHRLLSHMVSNGVMVAGSLEQNDHVSSPFYLFRTWRSSLIRSK